MVAAWTELPPSGGLPECAALVELADRLRWSAPELVALYAQRALAKGPTAGTPDAVRAQAFLGAAFVRLGRYAEAVEPSLAALRHADQAGLSDLVPSIRLDLASCSRGLGEPLLGCVILRPVLESTGARPASRAGAVAALVGCAEHVGRRDDLEDSLTEADRLLAADDGLSPDARRMERALLAVHTAAYHRRYGETEDAVDAARQGLGLVTKLRDSAQEGGRATARLTLELVCALLDDGELPEAERAAAEMLVQPVRAASADPVGRLLLAMATRIHVPAGRVERGRGMLGDATRIGERHGLDWLLADGLTAIANLDEAAGEPADALSSLRSARAAEYRQQRSTEAAKRLLMVEFGVRGLTVDAVNSLLRNVVRGSAGTVSQGKDTSASAVTTPVTGARPARLPQEPAETDAATGLLNREGLSRRLQAVRSGNRPVALTLVRLDPVESAGSDHDADGDVAASRAGSGGPGSDDALTTLAGRVRDIAPEDAELARSAGSELAVLLPHTTRDEAEEFAATIRESAIESDWLAETTRHEVSISTGVAQSGLDSATLEDADSLLTAARETLTPAEWDRPEHSSRPESSGATAPTGHQEIRDLLAPLLGHPSLSRVKPTEPPHRPDIAETGSASPPPESPAPAEVAVPGEAESISVLLGHSSGSGLPRVPDMPELEPVMPSEEGSASAEVVAAGEAESISALLGHTSPSRTQPESQRPPVLPETESPSTDLGQEPEPEESPASADVAEPEEGPAEVAAAREESISALLGRNSPSRAPSGSPRPPDIPQQESISRMFDGPSPRRSGTELDESSSPAVEQASSAQQQVDEPVAQGGRTSSGAEQPGGLGAERVASISAVFGEGLMSRQRPQEPSLGQQESASRADTLESGAAPEGGEMSRLLAQRQNVAEPDSIAAVFGGVPRARQTIPVVPEPEEEPGIPVPKKPDPEKEQKKKPDILIPPEPDAIPPLPPGHEPTPEVPPPTSIPTEPDTDRLDELLGPVQGPEPRPPDEPVRPERPERAPWRRDRSETASIAELLTEALVAYQETTPDEPPPAPEAPPVPDPVSENTPPAQRSQTGGSGRHRMPDWDSV